MKKYIIYIGILFCVLVAKDEYLAIKNFDRCIPDDSKRYKKLEKKVNKMRK